MLLNFSLRFVYFLLRNKSKRQQYLIYEGQGLIKELS